MSRFTRIADVKAPLPKGTRVLLLEMPNDPLPVPPGTEGTVVGGNSEQIWMKWDDGRTLNLLVGFDKFIVIPDLEDREIFTPCIRCGASPEDPDETCPTCVPEVMDLL